MVETTGNTSIEINATPEAVYAILPDLTRISDLSPECYKAEWEGAARCQIPRLQRQRRQQMGRRLRWRRRRPS